MDLWRQDSISILTPLVNQKRVSQYTYLIGVSKLGAKAFTTASTNNTALKHMPQDRKMPKVFLDVRNDSDSLFVHYGVALQGVEDAQLMESASQETTGSKEYLSGLAKCVKNNITGSFDQHRLDWLKAKKQSRSYSKPKDYTRFSTNGAFPKTSLATA